MERKKNGEAYILSTPFQKGIVTLPLEERMCLSDAVAVNNADPDK